MFQFDWTQPQMGGMLSQIIVKEERMLNERKPRVDIPSVTDPASVATRDSTWNDPKVRKPRRESPLGNTEKRQETRHCRSAMLHERRMHDNLTCLQRVQKGESSTLSGLTPELYTKLHPTYGGISPRYRRDIAEISPSCAQSCTPHAMRAMTACPRLGALMRACPRRSGMNDDYATTTTSQLIGMGNDSVPAVLPAYAKDRSVLDEWKTHTLNSSTRRHVEQCREELRSLRAPNVPTRAERKRMQHEQQRNSQLFGGGVPRSTRSAFCQRTGEMPLPP